MTMVELLIPFEPKEDEVTELELTVDVIFEGVKGYDEACLEDAKKEISKALKGITYLEVLKIDFT